MSKSCQIIWVEKIAINYEIRQANEQDIPRIAELNRLERIHHMKLDKIYGRALDNWSEFEKHLKKLLGNKNTRIFVAEYGGEVVGYLIGFVFTPKGYMTPKKMGYIEDAFVIEKQRRKGVCCKLFEHAVCWFKERKIKYIELSVDTKNEMAVNAWKKYRFRERTKKMNLELK